jgi:hypothetical protein
LIFHSQKKNQTRISGHTISNDDEISAGIPGEPSARC